jgi:hypothetical protein
MATTLKKFNVREGLSVGTPAIDIIDSQGNVTGRTVTATDFFIYPTYTAAELTEITGQIGWTAAVSDSSHGSNPNGMIAFWDTTHSRWSYIHDNSAV